MTDLERADERIQLICEKIRSETLDPAKEEAAAIIEQARKEADRIVTQAKLEAEKQQKALRVSLEEEKKVFQSTLQQASKQTLELLKVKIEQSLFNPKLEQWVVDQLGHAKEHAKLIEVLVQAIEKEGIRSELAVLIPKKFSAEEVTAAISQNVLKQLKDKTVQLADLPAGIQVRLVGKNMVLDLSEKALEDLIATFIRKDFRKVFFSA